MTDGVFRCQRYFRCSPGAGLFVSLDKLTVPVEEPDDNLKGNKIQFNLQVDLDDRFICY